MIFVSQGDVAGVGWGALLKLLENKTKYFNEKELANLHRLVIVGDVFARDEKLLKKIFHLQQAPEDPNEAIAFIQKRTSRKPLFLVQQSGRNYDPGVPSSTLALRAYQSFSKALKYTLAAHTNNEVSLVTLPVSKEHITKAGINFAGHTEVLAAAAEKNVFMCLYHPKLSVVLLTNHIPLARVPKKILEVDYQSLAEALLFFRDLSPNKKKMGLTGLNPHAGEAGVIGNEEAFLRTKLDLLAKHGLVIDGPLPADGAFSVQGRGAYSLLVACYHDQGLAPFKALFGLKGINITLNLPFLRVSPDHGTAFSLASQGAADPIGVLMSLRFALSKGAIWKKLSSSL